MDIPVLTYILKSFQYYLKGIIMLEQVHLGTDDRAIATYFESIWCRANRAKRVKEMVNDLKTLEKKIAIFKERIEVSKITCDQISEQYPEVLTNTSVAIKSYIQRTEQLIQTSCVTLQMYGDNKHPICIEAISFIHEATAAIRHTKQTNSLPLIRYFVETRRLPELTGDLSILFNELLQKVESEYAISGYPEFNIISDDDE